ncbi:GrpB family protein [Reichenbachiella ulvae]|uniref:GrpB family protein n=1 Tax=Reichenbachiella ulvae TaxID=2980104 RepID=A0ABT3CR92_9BACT|nr:GrpB family protein [Reichenbachiella ulvae]MCV9386019.1 GrpB family protein [Reichenbachiella ulvae]
MLIKKYTPDWTVHFVKLKGEIEKGLEGLDCQIEHVGSTSVANLDAKDIIDIDIVYREEWEFEKIKAGLIEIGYYHNGNQGIEQREVFKRTGQLTHEVLDAIVHHLYVCPMDSQALERHILSRDFMRKNDWARLKYQNMKYELAEQAHQDKKRYAELKELHVNDFINSIIESEKTNADQSN